MTIEDTLRTALGAEATEFRASRPDWDDVPRAARARTRRRLVRGFAVVVLASVGAVIMLTGGQGDDVRVSTGPLEEFQDPYLLPRSLPPGSELRSVTITRQETLLPFGTWIYGEMDSRGVVESGVRVELRPLFGPFPADREYVLGRRQRDEGTEGAEPFTATWTEHDIAVMVSAYGMSDDDAWRFAERMRVTTDPRPSVSVEGEEPAYAWSGGGEFAVGMVPFTVGLEIVLLYGRETDGPDLGIQLTWHTEAGPLVEEPAFAGDPRQRVDVRGHGAWLSRNGERTWLEWREAANLDVVVWRDGGDPADTKTVAEGLESVSGLAWARTVEAAQPSAAIAPCPDTEHPSQAESPDTLPTAAAAAPHRALDLSEESPYGRGGNELVEEYADYGATALWLEVRAGAVRREQGGEVRVEDQIVWTVVVAVDAERCPSSPTFYDGVPITFVTGEPAPVALYTPEETVRPGGA